MTRKLDCRGLVCPEPVVQVRDLLAEERPASLTVMVDNEAAKENVRRFLSHQGYQVSVSVAGDDFQVCGVSEQGACTIMEDEELSAAAGKKKILVLLSSDRLGHGDEMLGSALMLNFVKTLKEMGHDLWRVVMVNSGVKLAVAGADTLPFLQELARLGVSILVCGTCLNHFNLLEEKQVGETTNMLDIMTSLQVADQVINL